MSNVDIDNDYLKQMVDKLYPKELQSNKPNASGTEALFLDLNLSISNDILYNKIYDKQIDFDFDILSFPFFYGSNVPPATSQLIRFAKSSSQFSDFDNKNKILTSKLLK